MVCVRDSLERTAAVGFCGPYLRLPRPLAGSSIGARPIRDRGLPKISESGPVRLNWTVH
jgi:hypothetical protein